MDRLDGCSLRRAKICCWRWDCRELERVKSRRTLLGDDYETISKELLVTKTPQKLRNRAKNNRSSKNKLNSIKKYNLLYQQFSKWDPTIYHQICSTITTHRRNPAGIPCSYELASAAAPLFLLLQRSGAEILLVASLFQASEANAERKGTRTQRNTVFSYDAEDAGDKCNALMRI